MANNLCLVAMGPLVAVLFVTHCTDSSVTGTVVGQPADVVPSDTMGAETKVTDAPADTMGAETKVTDAPADATSDEPSQTCEPTTEVCDGLDNDCDDETDEDLGSTECGVGVCEHTVQNCVNGEPQQCDPLQGQATEVCNDLDDDCDGENDEGCPPDLFLDDDSMMLHGEHTYDHVRLTHGAVLQVTAFDGAPCQPETDPSGKGTLVLTARRITVDATSHISADGAGGGGAGCAEDNDTTINDSGAGGGYGGAGGASGMDRLTPGQPYGSADGQTIEMGSNGSTIYPANDMCLSLSFPPNPGGRGGGMVVLDCSELLLQGTISANGEQGGNGIDEGNIVAAGGGSGGGVLIRCDTVDQSGLIAASGGAGGDGARNDMCVASGGGGGGGGRIKLFASSYTDTGQVLVDGGDAGYCYWSVASPGAGEPGSLFP